MTVYCGIDWASDHHDVALVDHDGILLAKARIGDDAAGLAELLALLAEHGDGPGRAIPAAIETARGLLVAALRASGREVYAINPMAAARYRERTAVSRKKSDHLDALALANILRTDRDRHRALPADTGQAQAISVLARAQQDAVWERTRTANALRAHLREYYPGFLTAFAGPDRFTSAAARVILAGAPTPAHAGKLTPAKLRTLLARAGRTRGIEAEAVRIHAALRIPQMRQPEPVEAAMGAKTRALLRQLDAACTSADELEQAATDSFNQHPDSEIYLSFPGLGPLLAARVLAEIGDDPHRFADARGLKAYAGAAPVTRASGKTLQVKHRRVKNDRLAAAGYMWSLSALGTSPGARALYDQRRQSGDWNATALRRVNNKLLGCLHRCLQQRRPYDETTAFPRTPTTSLDLAA